MADTDLEVQAGYVYENSEGELRLVISVDLRMACPVAVWQTADPNLPKGSKAQGSATVTSFRKWAVKMRRATAEDLGVYPQIERRREWDKRDAKAIQRIKRALAQE